MPKCIGIVPHLFAKPLFDGLRYSNLSSIKFELIEDSFVQLSIKLRQQDIDGVFLSPIDYAKEHSLYRILPQVCAASRGESETVLLVFRENLRRIKTVVIDPRFSSEIVLTRIILAEKYDTIPQFVASMVSLDQALTQADAVLVVGDSAFVAKEMTNKLDLVVEWTDLTEMLFIHGFWVSREDALTRSEMNTLIESAQQGMQNVHNIQNDLHRQYLKHFRYELDEQALTALGEYFRMAYYHGILKDIPDVKLHPIENTQSLTPLSLN
ncbi:MAG: hypothetical protein HY707_03555 [Ignavibacteriae bacterium]|nr:hypothetical protein [Ignavibacteriota bacterium]